MIQKIELTNFKGFRQLRLENVSRITLLGGRNSVGKTSVLEAIFLFFDRGNPELVIRQFPWRGMGRVYLSTEQMFSPIFRNYILENPLTIALTIDGKEERLSISFRDRLPTKTVSKRLILRNKESSATNDERPVIHGRLDLRYSNGAKTENSSLILTKKDLTLRDDGTTLEKRPAIYVGPRVGPSPAEDAQRFSQLDVQGEVESAVSFLKEFDSRIQALSVIFLADSAVIHADVGLPRKIPVPQLGEGLSLMLSMFLAIGSAKNGTVLVDEIGAGIHHSYLPRFWQGIAKAADKFNCQVIGTTHSYECMQAAAEGLKSLTSPEFTYIRLDRDAQRDLTEPSTYTFPVLEAALESGWEVR